MVEKNLLSVLRCAIHDRGEMLERALRVHHLDHLNFVIKENLFITTHQVLRFLLVCFVLAHEVALLRNVQLAARREEFVRDGLRSTRLVVEFGRPALRLQWTGARVWDEKKRTNFLGLLRSSAKITTFTPAPIGDQRLPLGAVLEDRLGALRLRALVTPHFFAAIS